MSYDNIQDAAGAWVTPSWGVGYGGQGSWRNRHFATEADARAFFNEQMTSLPSCYPGMQTQAHDESGTFGAGVIRKFTIVNIKRDGKPGKLKQSVHLYRIGA